MKPWSNVLPGIVRCRTKQNYGCRLFGLTVLLVFLTLGSCPIRNALVHWVQPHPTGDSPKVPDHCKIISRDGYSLVILARHIPTIGRLLKDRPSLDSAINSGSLGFNPLQTE